MVKQLRCKRQGHLCVGRGRTAVLSYCLWVQKSISLILQVNSKMTLNSVAVHCYMKASTLTLTVIYFSCFLFFLTDQSKAMLTELCLASDEFDYFDAQAHNSITFCLKELRVRLRTKSRIGENGGISQDSGVNDTGSTEWQSCCSWSFLFTTIQLITNFSPTVTLGVVTVCRVHWSPHFNVLWWTWQVCIIKKIK